MAAKNAFLRQLSLLREANSPNHRSKAMEKKALQLDDVDHKSESSGASAKVGEAYDAYSILKEKCVACKLAEDAVVSQLQLVVSLHDYADAKLDEYNTAKTAAEAASTKATSLETARDQACAGAPEAEDLLRRGCGHGWFSSWFGPGRGGGAGQPVSQPAR